MIGRAIYHSPYFLADIEKEIFNNENVPSRSEVMENLIPYIQEQTSKGVQLNHIMRHTVGLFHGQNGSRTWKQYLSKNMCIRDADLQKVNHIMDQVKKTNPIITREDNLDILSQSETIYLIFDNDSYSNTSWVCCRIIWYWRRINYCTNFILYFWFSRN